MVKMCGVASIVRQKRRRSMIVCQKEGLRGGQNIDSGGTKSPNPIGALIVTGRKF